MKSIVTPPGNSVDDERFTWEVDESAKGLWLVFGIGVVMVVLTVALVFDSVWAAAMVFLSLPMALGGVAATFWMTGTAFGREAAVGVILVVGLAVNQAILLVDAALGRRREGVPTDERRRRPIGAAEVVYAARDRAGMIMLVTLTTLASLVPLALGTDADSLFGSIALATAGGTVAGTIGALGVVPAMLVGRRRRGRHLRGAGAEPATANGSA
jgi:HAE1 family hydrophobic/amphiphilic exporter-1